MHAKTDLNCTNLMHGGGIVGDAKSHIQKAHLHLVGPGQPPQLGKYVIDEDFALVLRVRECGRHKRGQLVRGHGPQVQLALPKHPFQRHFALAHNFLVNDDLLHSLQGLLQINCGRRDVLFICKRNSCVSDRSVLFEVQLPYLRFECAALELNAALC